MKKAAFAITLMSLTLIFIGSAMAQEKRRPAQEIGNPSSPGGKLTSGVKNQKSMNLGDTATHEVGHKGKRRNAQFRPNPSGDGTTEHFFRPNPTGDGTTEQIRKAPKANGNNAKSKNPNRPGNTQNLLPYVEQDNVYKTKPRKPNANRRAQTSSPNN